MNTLRRMALATLFAVICSTALFADTPKYIFYFIGDGMGMGHVMIADSYLRATGYAEPMLITTFPYAGSAMTYSASSPVTDSAAGGTALATGVKTRNNMVGMAPDTTAVVSIASRLKERGYGIGVVTSNSPDDATPAGFYAHAASRSMLYEIDCQAADSGVDFLGGANLRGMKDKEGNPTDLLDHFARAGVKIAYGPEELTGKETERVALLNSNRELNNTLGYAIDSVAGMTLPVLTRECLGYLERNSPEGFFMMVENGLTDWASHANDAGTLVREMQRLNEAVAVAYDFYLEHPDETLIIVTADHDTGGATLGNANPRLKYNAKPELLALQQMSKEAFSNEVWKIIHEEPDYSWQQMRSYMKERLGFWRGIEPTEGETRDLESLFADLKAGKTEGSQKTLYADFNAFTAEVFRLISEHAGIGWITTTHTGNLVPVFAIGAGAEAFARMQDNIEIPQALLRLTEGEQ